MGRRPALAPVSVLAATAAVGGYVAVVDPNQAGHYPTCPFLLLTGWYCPGCGSLRAVHALAHGDLSSALARNPLLVVAALALGAGWAIWLRHALTGAPRAVVVPVEVVWGVVVAVCAFWVLRNLPGQAWLAP